MTLRTVAVVESLVLLDFYEFCERENRVQMIAVLLKANNLPPSWLLRYEEKKGSCSMF